MKSIRFLSLAALLLVGIISCGKKGVQSGTDNCNQELISLYNSAHRASILSSKADAQASLDKLKSEFGGVTCFAEDTQTNTLKSVNIDSEIAEMQKRINSKTK